MLEVHDELQREVVLLKLDMLQALSISVDYIDSDGDQSDSMNFSISKYLNSYTEAAPLAVFRIGFGIMMFASIIRFWLNGWIEKLYITPKFHFSYYNFEWVKPLGDFTYLLFIICGLAALFIAFGYKYRIAIITFFLSRKYSE